MNVHTNLDLTIKNRKMLQKNTKTQDFQEIGEDIFVKDTFLAVFVQKSGRRFPAGKTVKSNF